MKFCTSALAGTQGIRLSAQFWPGVKPAEVNGNLPVDIMEFGADLGFNVLQSSDSNVSLWHCVNNR